MCIIRAERRVVVWCAVPVSERPLCQRNFVFSHQFITHVIAGGFEQNLKAEPSLKREFASAHGPTIIHHDHWVKATSVLPLPYQLPWEPYVVFFKHCVPPFDPRFYLYGNDKVIRTRCVCGAVCV